VDHRVALLKCPNYESEQVEAAVRQAVDLLGGIRQYVKPGQRVLVKPNMLLPSDPARAIITHPAVVRAVVRLAQGAGGKVLVADNPVVVPPTLRAWQIAYAWTGWAGVAEETGAELNTHILAEQRPHPEGKMLKRVDTSSFLTQADVVISVPKLKTHGLMRFTGAVKNLFGTVPGATKFGYHVKLQTVERFAEMLLDLVSFVRPALSIMDAIVGMDGNGPSAGQPFPIGAILAGPDPVAMDVAALGLVGHEPASVATIACAIRRGWTTGSVGDLTILGDDLAQLQVNGFRLPAGGRGSTTGVPAFLQHLGSRQLVANPWVNERCVGCGQCIDNCPMQTISPVDGRARLDLGNCIRCYCCHELCPEQAIELRQPFLRKIAARLGQ
jgi:uncharacterized protein (DUF362 family)/Pyruvate/2-oxoacid:ferredoxin oxidoreductase delta subunit